MRPVAKLTLCAFFASVIAAPAVAASADYYLKLGDVKGELAAKGGAGKQIEILSWSWGTATASDWDGTIKSATAAGKFGAVGGMHRDDQLTPAAGAPAEKRQHGWVTVSKPLDRGAVRVKVKFPWLDCKAGAAFPDAVLQNDAGRYEFQEVMVSSCSTAPSGAGGAAAADEVTLTYAKVIVRGWDPAKKEN